VYGPVRTVVWQGSAGDRRPYADLVGKSDVIRAATARGLSQVSKHPYYAQNPLMSDTRFEIFEKWSRVVSVVRVSGYYSSRTALAILFYHLPVTEFQMHRGTVGRAISGLVLQPSEFDRKAHSVAPAGCCSAM
jgi:hypothetical protein